MTKIYHNPKCSKSRATLQILRDAGVEPEIVEYLKTPPTAEELAAILHMLDMTPRDLMRTSEADYKENGLGDSGLTDADLVAAMVAHPKLIERPIVVADGKAVVGRPPENVKSLL